MMSASHIRIHPSRPNASNASSIASAFIEKFFVAMKGVREIAGCIRHLPNDGLRLLIVGSRDDNDLCHVSSVFRQRDR